MNPTRKKTVLITGCSQHSLGSALAQAFHASTNPPYRVFATARSPPKMAHLSALGIETLRLDVLSAASIAACIADITARTGGSLDMLVNNAGAGYVMPLLDADLGKGRAIFEVNVWAVLAVTQAFAGLVVAARGVVVNNTSVASVANAPLQGVYNASKAAAAMMTDNLRLELGPFGVRVVDLRTGSVRSNFHPNRAVGNVELPADSMYGVAREEIEAIMPDGGFPDEKGMDQGVWARKVVNGLRGGRAPAQLWKGSYATTMWFTGTFVPSKWMDRVIEGVGKLDVVRKRYSQKTPPK